jgi:hypothetical protein
LNNSVNTVPALLFALAAEGCLGPVPSGCTANVRIEGNAIQFYNSPLLAGSRVNALTMGNVVLNKGSYDPYVLFHETRHTYQGEFLGFLYVPAHLFGGAYSMFATGDWWAAAHPFETHFPTLPPALAPWAP